MTTAASIEIRRADPRDAPLLVALMDEVGREDGAWLLATDAGRSVVDERRYLRAVRRHPAAAVFVADEDGHLVGRLSLARDPHPASAHVADLGLLVAGTYRRRGLGRRLLLQAVDWAREVGVTKLELHVFPWNEPALALYDAFGFVREGYRVGHYLRAGDPVDAILMAYHVPSAPLTDPGASL